MSAHRTVSEFIKLLGIQDPQEWQIDLFQNCKNWMIAKPVIESLIKKGYSNGEIATRVGVTIDSVKWARRSIKNGVDSTHQQNTD